MPRFYVENDMVRFTRKNITLVDMELYDGRRMDNLEPRYLFPLSGQEKYITLLDEEGIEKAIIRDLKSLLPESRAIIEDCLREYYLIPKVTKINDCKERYGVLTIDVETDRGSAQIEIRNILHGLKLLYGYRVLLRDSNDNRYEIPDLRHLDNRSRQLLDQFL